MIGLLPFFRVTKHRRPLFGMADSSTSNLATDAGRGAPKSTSSGSPPPPLSEADRARARRAAADAADNSMIGLPPWMKRMPSRNTILFFSVVFSVGGMYMYDRWKAKKLKREYIDLVRWRGHETLAFDQWPRKVQVLTSRVPDDDQSDRALTWWKKYVKVNKGECFLMSFSLCLLCLSPIWF
jgi:Inner membrane protein import complex subunit Tim54